MPKTLAYFYTIACLYPAIATTTEQQVNKDIDIDAYMEEVIRELAKGSTGP